MTLTALPSDILILVLQNSTVQELAALSRTCRLLNALVFEFGWTGYLRANPRPSFSLSHARALWPAKTQVRCDVLTDRSWSRPEFAARPLSRPWLGKLQPILTISRSRLIVAAGTNIYSYKFGHPIDGEAPSVLLEGVCGFEPRQGKNRDITGITFVDDGGLDRTLCVGFHDGTLERVSLTPSSYTDQIPPPLGSVLSQLQDGDFIESLSSEGNTLLSLSSSGRADLTNMRSSFSSHSIDIKARGWVSHLSLHSSGPYAAFGTSSRTPLTVHSIATDRLSETPSAVLCAKASFGHPIDQVPLNAVYGLARAPLSSPWGASPQILVSGWFDGDVRCYDLRSSSRASITTQATKGPAPLRPVLSLYDPLSDEAIYSIACGGGSSSHIAAGKARHGVVSFWDVRSPSTGWSVHAPGNDISPVYSIILESSRLFGVTHARPFVYDFSPGVTLNTYPSLPEGRSIDGLKRKKGWKGAGYYVTKYYHDSVTSHHH